MSDKQTAHAVDYFSNDQTQVVAHISYILGLSLIPVTVDDGGSVAGLVQKIVLYRSCYR